MNIFAIVVFSALVVEFLVSTAADVLNLKSLKQDIPKTLTGVYQPDEYRQSQDYTRTRTRFGFVTGSFGLLVILLFWFTGGFNSLDQIVRSWGFGSIVNGLAYLGILLIGYELLTFPFGIYSTFVIEERFGFNRTTPLIFFTDLIKGLVLTVMLGGPVLTGLLLLFEYGGDFAWLFCWLGIIIYTIIMQFVAPVWLMPLFNKFTPMESGELREAIQSYARSAGYAVKNIFVMDGSKRSTKANAFFTGFGRTRRIALFDTLIDKHNLAELVAILAHEIGHYKKKHLLQGMVLGVAHTGLIFYLFSVFLNSPGLYQAFYMEQSSLYTGFIFFGLLYAPVEMVLSSALNALSRRNEYQADQFAVETTSEGGILEEALKKLSADNLSNLTPHPLYVALNYSHPPLLQRVEAIRRHKNRNG